MFKLHTLGKVAPHALLTLIAILLSSLDEFKGTVSKSRVFILFLFSNHSLQEQCRKDWL